MQWHLAFRSESSSNLFLRAIKMFFSPSHPGNYSIAVPKIKPRESPWLHKTCLWHAPGSPVKGEMRLQEPVADDSYAPCHSVREIYCNSPSASPGPNPHRHPSARQALEIRQQQEQGRNPGYSTLSLDHLRVARNIFQKSCSNLAAAQVCELTCPPGFNHSCHSILPVQPFR